MKYKLTDETIEVDGITLHRIECVEAFERVKAGDKGGYVQSVNNLSQRGQCWIYGDACVYGKAYVSDNAIVATDARVYDNARITGSARVTGNSIIKGYAAINGNAYVTGNAMVSEHGLMTNWAQITDNVEVSGRAWIGGEARLYDHVKVYGDATVFGDFSIGHYTIITSNKDYIVFKNFWSSGRFFLWTRSNDMWTVGCFYGTGEELIKKAYRESSTKGKYYEKYVRFVEELNAIDTTYGQD